MYRTFDYKCEDCKEETIELFLKDKAPNTIICKQCFGDSHRALVSAPVVLRASFADGQKRGDRWELTKESAALEQEASKMRKSNKKDEAIRLKTEAKKLAKRAGTKRDKTDK